MATAQEYNAYAQKLEPIYREILAAFPRIEPNRRIGYGLAFQTLSADFEERGLGISLGEIIEACRQLAGHGLMEIKHGIFVRPTEKGEELVKAITGKQPKPVTVPILPPPPA